MTRNFITISFSVLLFSCNQFNGEIRKQGNSGSIQSVILINTSKDKKLKFTIKKQIENENGKENSIIEFYELEPGDEKNIGETASFSAREFYSKIVHDTIKEYIHFDKILKKTNSDIEISKELDKFTKRKYVFVPNYYRTYTRNGLVYDPTISSDGGINAFWGSGWKSIDSVKVNNIKVITYLEPRTVVDSTKPKKQEKFIYSYEIRGQRIIK